MPASNPSPPQDASATVRGLVNLIAQTFAGVKTFTSRIVASLGITAGAARLDLRSDLGAAGADVGVVVGVTTLQGSVSGVARIFSVRTGLGGSETEHAHVTGRGDLEIGAKDSGKGVHSDYYREQGNVSQFRFYFEPAAGAFGTRGGNWHNGRCDDNAGSVAHRFGNHTTLTNPAARLHEWRDGEPGTVRVAFSARGTLWLPVAIGLVAATGTPAAAATQNAPKGRITVPSAATSVTVTNDQVTADSFVSVEWEALPGVTHSVSYAAGSFTVTFGAALGSSLTFRYFVVR
jgi:hypothetical protein